MDLPDPGIELGSPALQVDSLPTDLSGKPMGYPGHHFSHVIGQSRSKANSESKNGEISSMPSYNLLKNHIAKGDSIYIYGIEELK